VRNQSDRFEARFSLVEVTQSPSLLLQGMVGSQMPIAVSHGEGQVEVRDARIWLSWKAKVWWRCALSITSAK
jgi:phosphoribosylformylglycinamidine (FGAM) synthase-like amidotransferase family enzyme